MDEKTRADLVARKANLELALTLLDERFQVSSRVHRIANECGISSGDRDNPRAIKEAIRNIERSLDFDSWVISVAKVYAKDPAYGDDRDALTTICQRYLADRKIPLDDPK